MISANRVLLELLALENQVDDRRGPGKLTPRCLFPDPTLYLCVLERLRRGGAITIPGASQELLWNEWFVARYWLSPRFWHFASSASRPSGGCPATSPLAAAQLYDMARLSEATGYLGRELVALGLNPAWAQGAQGAIGAVLQGRSLGRALYVIERALQQTAFLYLRGRSLFDIASGLPGLLASAVTCEAGEKTPPPCLLSEWMSESLAQVGVDYVSGSPEAIAKARRLPRHSKARLIRSGGEGPSERAVVAGCPAGADWRSRRAHAVPADGQ